jgi:antitoxin FitA
MQVGCLQNGVMVTVTIRDVPDDVRAALTREARERGRSLQAHLLDLLAMQARFARNRTLLLELSERFGDHGGVRDGGPDAADVVRAARSERLAADDPGPLDTAARTR